MLGTKHEVNGWQGGDALFPDSGSERKINAYIGKGVTFRGMLAHNGTIRIDGEMEGEITTEGCLLIGEGALVSAKITAGLLICKGKIKGDVYITNRAEFRRPAVLLGSVTTPVLSIEEGVRLTGDVRMIAEPSESLHEPVESLQEEAVPTFSAGD